MYTEINANIMTPKQIRTLVKEVISEALNEQVTIDVSNPNTLTDPQKQTLIQKSRTTTRDNKIGTPDKPVEFVEEGNIEEMARKAKGYQIVNPEFDTTPYANKNISGISMASIIDYIKDNPGVEKKDIQTQFNFVRPQIANALINGLKDAGIIAKMGEIEVDDETGEVTVTDEPEAPTSRAGAEDFFIGNRTSNFFSTGEPSLMDDEDEMGFPEEPEIPELPADRPPVGGLADEDYAAWMEYNKLKERLARTKSALMQAKKMTRGRDDLSLDSNEMERLAKLKTSLEQRVQNVVDSSEYVKNKIEQNKTKSSEEDEINESIKRRLQQLANI
jgi:translation initiation factor 2B subunit (eIF-2B alpha/beta/delta family)